MGKNWWRKALGLSNAQRQLSRKIGVPLSGRRSRRKLFGGGRGKGGCLLLLLGGVGLAAALLWGELYQRG